MGIRMCPLNLHPNKIIGVCSQNFDSVIRDWLEPPRQVPWKPLAKTSGSEAASGKEQDGVLISCDVT